MHPIAQTIETARELSRHQPEIDVLQHLQDTGDLVQQIVPELIGLSIAWVDQGVAFTLMASDDEIAALDGLQYLAGGPCVESVEREESLEAAGADLFDEASWQHFAQSLAATSVRSTLTLLLTDDGHTVGSVNLYAASDDAFEGHHQVLADLLGAQVSDVVRNADLSFSTRTVAEDAPETLRSQQVVDTATGILAAALGLDVDEASWRLDAAARRAGISNGQFARALVALYP